MNYNCDKCSSKLIKKSSTSFGCPGCHSQFEISDTKLIRTAQFGGNIAKPNIYGPGSSPLFDRSTNRSRGVNTRMETSFDSIISRTHHPAPIDPERNMEKRLEQFHDHAEEDLIPYHLSPKERQRLKIRKQIREREKFYENAAKRIDENSVEYIKEHFQPSKQQMQTINESLSDERKYEDAKPKSIYDEKSPDQIKPERRHTVAKIYNGTFPEISETDAEFDFNPGFVTWHFMKGVGGWDFLTNDELDYSLDKKEWDLWHRSLNEDSNSFRFPGSDESYKLDFEPDDSASTNNNLQFNPELHSIQEGIDQLMKAKPAYPPQIIIPDVNIDKWTGEGKEPRSPMEKYPTKNPSGPPPPLPKMF